MSLSLLVACHDHEHGDDHDFQNLDECVVDHIGLGEIQAITHCLLDFPDLHPAFADQAECEAWVEANGGYPDSREAACVDYFLRLGA